NRTLLPGTSPNISRTPFGTVTWPLVVMVVSIEASVIPYSRRYYFWPRITMARKTAVTNSPQIRIQGEAIGQRQHLLLHRRFDRRVAFVGIGHLQAVQHLRDQLADLAEFGLAEAARRAGRRSQADARGDKRLFRIEGNAVLVA